MKNYLKIQKFLVLNFTNLNSEKNKEIAIELYKHKFVELFKLKTNPTISNVNFLSELNNSYKEIKTTLKFKLIASILGVILLSAFLSYYGYILYLIVPNYYINGIWSIFPFLSLLPFFVIALITYYIFISSPFWILSYLNDKINQIKTFFDFKEFNYQDFRDAFSELFKIAGYEEHYKKMIK